MRCVFEPRRCLAQKHCPASVDAHCAFTRDLLLTGEGYVRAALVSMCCNACRSRGKAVQVHVFKEDSHALDQPDTAFVQWPRILAFFRMHLQGK